jgi:hypothetical protein
MSSKKGAKGQRKSDRDEFPCQYKKQIWFEQNAKMTNHEIRGG